MIGLLSFGRLVVNDLGKEQFYAFYLSAGMVASYISYLAKFAFKTTAIASLGASGAVYAVAALAIRSMPDLSVSLIFLPFLPISGRRDGCKVLMSSDSIVRFCSLRFDWDVFSEVIF